MTLAGWPFSRNGSKTKSRRPKKNKYRPKNRNQLKDDLQGNQTHLFTLTHKFGIEKGKTYPKLTDREDWIVIVDESIL